MVILLSGLKRKAHAVRVERLYRYPVKGLTAEALEEVRVEPGQTFPWDRAFALAQGDAPFDPAAPVFLRKSNFMCLLKNERIAGLHAAFDPHDHVLAIDAPDGSRIAASPMTPEGRAEIAAFLSGFLGDEARGEPRFHYVPGHAFTDDREKLISLISMPSLQALEAAVGAPRDKLRFRANIYVSGGAPWADFALVDGTVQIGGAILRVTKRIVRCNATQVNPATASRDADPVRELRAAFGHVDLGVYLAVVEGGRISVGDTVTLLEHFPSQLARE